VNVEFSAAAGGTPRIVGETSSFIVVYKPPRMHSAPLRENEDGTLLGFAAETYPEIRSVRGWKAVEGGLVHRLDYDTGGLLLIARTQAAMDALRDQQENDRIVKEYTALSAGRGRALPGFPPSPYASPGLPVRDKPGIASAFRSYGVDRMAVRPVLPDASSPAGENESIQKQKIYRTEVVSVTTGADGNECFRLRLRRGYRHQIRCHLAWVGRPIVNDSLYGGVGDNAILGGCLALCAATISFHDPLTGRHVRYSLDGTAPVPESADAFT
jgi:23S rRNA pseudouridine1911/1915/1917 synthase